MKRILSFLIATLVFQQVSSAEIWTKILDSPFYTALANTPNGLVAGEFDTRTQLNPYNGLSISKNVGAGWDTLGLQGRGITGVAFLDNKLYATTYYFKNSVAGLFASNDRGTTWDNIGPNISASSVAVDSKAVYLGGYSHGLWVSKDAGQTFTQKIGTGFYGPKIFTILSNENVVIAGSAGKTYRSINNGDTWQEISSLAGKQINHLVFAGDTVFAGTYDNDGLYKSSDSGAIWTKVDNFGISPIGALTYFQNYLYVGKYDSVAKVYSIYKSGDLGQTWENTNLNLPNVTAQATSMSWLYSQPNFIVVAISGFGIYKMEIQLPPIPTFKFLDMPWESRNTSELFDKIYTFFDHSYPLLGDSAYKEPAAAGKTTLDFWGDEGLEPDIYYSSHSGIDFALPYGKEIKAPADGMASYYYCSDCGYSIKIDHLNGYQTTYMHLQKDRLFTTEQNIPVFKGNTVGKVGLTGNTTGPHLHFEVTKDANQNNTFSDDFPQGRVDPFGWLSTDSGDPWNGYFWADAFGQHTGQQSAYLWEINIPQVDKLITPENSDDTVTFENKKFTLSNTNALVPYNFSYRSFAEPRLPEQQKNLKYIPDTSFLLEIYDTLKNKVTNVQGTIQMEINISAAEFNNLNPESIKIYYYDIIDNTWKALDTNVDLTTKTVSAETNHLSRFAVFADAIDNIAPETTINITGPQSSGWYTELPTISLASGSSDLDKTFYSMDQGATWSEYSSPFKAIQDGVVTIFYRSSDKNGNYENAKSVTIKVNTSNKWIKTLKITGGQFTVL